MGKEHIQPLFTYMRESLKSYALKFQFSLFDAIGESDTEQSTRNSNITKSNKLLVIHLNFNTDHWIGFLQSTTKQ